MPRIERPESASGIDQFVDDSVDLTRIPDVEWTMRYSELNTLAKCATQYQIEYVLGLKPPSSKPSMIRGSAVHAWLQGWYQSFAEDDQAGRERDPDRAWIRAYRQLNIYEETELGGHLPETIRAKVDWAVAGYRERYDTDADWYRILWVEHHRIVPLVDVEIGDALYRVLLRTTADLVTQSRITGRIRLIDHKSAEGRDVSKDAFSKENQLDPQRGLYTASFKRRGPVIGRLPIWSALHNAVRCDQLKRKMTIEERFGRHPVFFGDIELDQIWADTQELAREAVRQRLGIGIKYPSPDSLGCKWCSLKEPHIMARQTGRPLEQLVKDFGFKTEAEHGQGESFVDLVDGGF